MSQESQEKPGGNTKTPGSKNQLYVWVLTIPYEECTASQLSQHLKGFCKRFKFQGEKGNETGYKHWQCVISLKNKEYFNTVKNLLPYKAHIEPCKDYFAAWNYCGKEDTRIEGPYDTESVFLNIITVLKPWQEKVIQNLQKDNDRYIWWYWDEIGNIGKSALCKYMFVNLKAEIFKNAKSGDIGYAVSDQPKICIFDFSRSQEDYVNYGILEDLKNGFVFSSKYESKAKVFNSPSVIVFANFEPDCKKMSADRWKVFKITND